MLPSRRTPSFVSIAFTAGALGGICAGVLDVLVAWSYLPQFLPSLFGKVILALRVGALYAGAGALLATSAAGLFLLLVRFTHLGTLLLPTTTASWRYARGAGGAEGRLALAIAWLISAPLLLRPALGVAASTIADRHNPTLILAAIICATLAALGLTIPVSFALARFIALLFQGRPAGRIRTTFQQAATPVLAPPICLSLVLCWLILRGWTAGQAQRPMSLVLLGIGDGSCILAWVVSRPLWRRTLDSHRRLRAGHAQEGLALVAIVTATVCAAWVAVLVTVMVGRVLLHHNPDPRMGSQLLVGLTILLLWGAVPLAAASGWLLEALMRRILPPSWQHRLAHPHAPYVAGAFVLGAVALVVSVISRTVIPLLYLRPEGALGLWIAATLLCRPAAERIGNRLAAWQTWVRWAAGSTILVALWAGGLSLTADSAGVKAANSWCGLTGPLLAAVRRMADLDGDGFSPILGGADCNDRDPTIHPLAFDIPGDGIDQNCSGEDAPPLPAAMTSPPGRPSGVPAGLNILLITMDTVRAGHLGTYGYQRPTTPSLDAWAKASVVFDNAWSNSSFTRPSITGILTGRYVSQVLWATQSNRQVIAANNGTIGAVAKHSGAYSGAIISCPGYLNRRLGFQYGFDDFISPASPFQPKESSPTRTPETPELIFEWMKRPSADEQANIAIQWMEDRTGHQFFLWVHLIDTHPPYSHHIGTPEFGSDADSMADHELRFTDSQVGRILEWLEQTGVGARTAVFVTSDHGIYHGERRLPNQERYLYPEFTRVPLIVHIPGLPAGRVSIPVSHIDILPTVAQLVGVSIAIPLPGRSLLPLMSHAPDGRARRPIFQIVSDGDQQRRAVVDGCALLIHNILPESTYERYDGCRRGADLLTDEYDPVRDGNLRDLLSRLEDESQVPLPPWTP